MPSANHLTKYINVLKDIQRVLWQAAADDVPPRVFVYAELKRRLEHSQYLIRTGMIRLSESSKPSRTDIAYRVCKWLVEDNTHYVMFVQAFTNAADAMRRINIDPHTVSFAFSFDQRRWEAEALGDNPIRILHLNFYYIGAEPRIWDAVLKAILNPSSHERQLAENFVRTSEAQALLAVYADISPLRLHDVYNLSEMFDALNAQYFGGSVPKPLIAWTSRANYRTVGSYHFVSNMILISKILNDRRVPEFAVRFVLYHEMLHIVHGYYVQNGRHFAHTPEFLEDERKFEQYEEAERALRMIKKLTSEP